MLLTPTTQRVWSRELLDVLIRAGLVAVLAIFCFRIFVPFLNLMVWALILAITLYPLQVRLRRTFAGKDGLIATLIVLVAFIVAFIVFTAHRRHEFGVAHWAFVIARSSLGAP